MPEYKECEHYGVDPKIVKRFESRITRLLRDMDKHGLSIFCGSTCTIRANDFYKDRQLVVGHFRAANQDGGDGGTYEGDDGLLRGE